MSLRTEIRKGLDDIEAGRTVDGDAAFQAARKRLEESHGLSFHGKPQAI